MPDKKPCAFCPENGLVNIIAQDDVAYLVAALGPDMKVLPGCFLIIPKEHIEDPDHLPDIWYRSVKHLRSLIPGWNPDDWNESTNKGHFAGQRQPHVHVWQIQRESTDEPIGLATYVLRSRTAAK